MSGRVQPKQVILVAIVAVLAFLVLRDRSAGGSEATAADSPGATYRHANSVTRGIETLVAQRDEWAAADSKARRSWAQALATIIQAPSVNVAESSLRAFIEEQMRVAGLTLSVSSPMPRRTPVDGEPLRVIGLTLDFDAPNPEALHALLDRVENAAAPRMVVTDLEIRGPGKSGRDGLHVKMDVVAMAWLGEGAGTGGAGG
ncbi:MAG: hypothetical protein H6813_05615 [Phycisphaeraceae bacterium]|nr:hypothetical protein [Phycisphaeraceae bacterium]MCB9847945.1 hypothetical protein [Phycisphaeraceae bacterium]